MAVGVFGKLPARRDYVQHGVDRRLMEALDPWLQRAVADSRDRLGAGWLDAWLQAPIWRFWLGTQVAGSSVLGAIMPSVDGVGRYFPLCVLGAFAGASPPEEDEHSEWFAAVETLMLETLAEGGTYEELLAGLDALPPPAPAIPRTVPVSDVPSAFAAERAALMGEFYDRYSCWWVPSPPDRATPPRVLVRRGLPAPGEYASMIAPDAQPELSPAMGGG